VSHPEKVTDYAYRAVHELTVAGKAITAARYGRQPEKSYFNGCSTGGRQGLKEAQLFPEDYDAIIAGAPASNWSALMSMSVLIQRNLTGPQGLDVGKLALLREGAISACDAPDGVSDRVITEPRRCGFNPASLQCKGGESGQCLSAAEVAAAQRIYKGVVTKEGKTRMPGTGPASELLWAAYASPQFGIGTNYFRNLVMRDPKWDPTQFDVDTDLARAERIDNGAIAAMSPDLGRFFARGGKLITYHGTTDGLISYVNSVNYFESVIARLGRATVKKSARLYVIPGMDHCSGGEGAHSIDWLGGLDAWATSGVPPESLPSLHPAIAPPGMPGMPAPPASKPFERPACPYPQVARYKGAGDTTQAASFECRTPQ
jgi:feruloyl esterase